MQQTTKRPVFEQNLDAPDLRRVFSDQEARRAAYKYWVKDPVSGGVDYAVHYGLRWTGSIDVCSRIGGMMGRRAGPKYYPTHAANARRNLAVLRPDIAEHDLDAGIGRMYENSGRTMAEFSILERIAPAGRIEVVGFEHLTNAVEAGRGIIVAGLHIGNWELIGSVGLHRKLDATAFYEPPTNRFRHKLARRSRLRYGESGVLPSRGGALWMARYVRDGGICYILVDEYYNGTVYGPRLGRPVPLAGNIVLAARYALLCDVDIVVAHCERIGGANFRITFTSPLPKPRDSDRATTEERIDDLALRIEEAAEPLLREHAAQWYYLGDLKLD